MKINRLDAHDRFLHFTSQNFSIDECCQDLINQRPFGNNPFYIYVHARTDDDGVTKRLLWQPRLTRPKAQTNAMLFKAYPGTDIIKTMWIIPARELWAQYTKGKITSNITITQNIHDFEHNRAFLDTAEDDDLDYTTINQIYFSISQQAKIKKARAKINPIC